MKRTIVSITLFGAVMFSLAESARAAKPNNRQHNFSQVEAVIQKAIAGRAFPGCSLAIGRSGRRLLCQGYGHLSYGADDAKYKVTATTLYDLASLTKVIGTTSVVMSLVRDGRLATADSLAKFLPAFARGVDGDVAADLRSGVNLEHLLTHSSGLPAWSPLYKTASTYQQVVALAQRQPLATRPAGRYRYSDLGFILLGHAAAQAGKKPLAELEQSLVFGPLGMRDTQRSPPRSLRHRIAPTEQMPGKKTFWHGVVHDENARAGEGKTGHAGLFSTAGDLSLFAREMLLALGGESRHFPRELAERFTRRRGLAEESSRALGWDTVSGNSSSGTLMSDRAFGHTGFTGTSLWIDPKCDLYVILLTNRVHPTRKNSKMHTIRRQVADAAVAALQRP